jgi:hypothetical protein
MNLNLKDRFVTGGNVKPGAFISIHYLHLGTVILEGQQINTSLYFGKEQTMSLTTIPRRD